MHILKPFTWFAREFGWTSIHATGRNAYIIIISRALRMFAHGAVTLILAPFLANLGVKDYYIGLFMTLTLLGDVFLGMYLTLIADRFGRRRVLLLGSIMMLSTGLIFATSQSYYILLLAAVLGVVSATGTDFGPFRSIEESMISEITMWERRSDVLTWYIMLSLVGSSVGSEVCGRIVQGLEGWGWKLGEAYRVVFWVYTATGVGNAMLAMGLGEECEMKKAYEQVSQEEGAEWNEMGGDLLSEETQTKRNTKPNRRCSTSFSQISAPTRSIFYKFWALLAIDSMADGLAPYALTVYYMDQKFHPEKSTLGDVTSVAYFLGAASSIFAGSLARRFGLVNTMVFTHAPSSAAILLFPLPSSFAMTVALLFVRTGLHNLDQAPRGAFIAAVSRPHERTAVLGIAGMLRTLAAMPGPFVAGSLAGSDLFRYAFILAGSIRLAYDVGLYVFFSGMEPARNDDGSL